MDAAEYKHVVLGLIFLKYVSDSFEEKYRQLLAEGYGDEEDRDEYFLSKFASAEGKLGGEFYTPSCIVRTLVSMIEPFEGQIFDPACGSGGMFCQSARFVKEHQGNVRDISIFGQESNPTTQRCFEGIWKCCFRTIYEDAEVSHHLYA